MAPPKVTQWVEENFPKPRVDPEWLDGCCEWLIGDQHIDPVTSFPKFTHQVKDQLLQSDLSDSMMHGTGLDIHIDKFTGNLKGPPVLVQIVAITDTGVSAYQLEQVRAAREEHILSGSGDKEGEEDGDVDIEGEGPMPKYPRGSLRLRLSDGVTKLEAMEYRPLPQISLGPTPLGYKLQLKGTLIRNGMAFLEPSTVVFLGGAQDQLEARQLEDFKRGLRVRLGLPVEDEPNMPASVAAPARPVVAAARSPLRDISPPPSPHPFSQHDDEMGLGTRRRRVPQQTQQIKPSSFATPPPLRDIKGKGRAKLSSGSLSKVDDAGSDDYGMMGIDDDDFADADFLANLSRVEKEALTSSGDPNESQASNTGGLDLSFMSVEGSSGSFVVVEGDKKTYSSGSGSAPIPPSSPSSKATEQPEVIEIGSSDDEMGSDDKENEPVATRHVKRRTEDLDAGARERGRGLVASQGWNPGSGSGPRKTGGLGNQSQNQNRTQKESQDLKSRALVMSSDVIDLSDSDDD